MGFVAALSSSIAFIILIMSAQLLNILNASINRDKVMASVHVEIQEKKLTPELKKQGMISYYLSENDVSNLNFNPVSYTHLTLPTTNNRCRSRWSPYH